MAVDRFAKGKTYSQLTACGAIWADIWKVIELMDRKRINVDIHKVKARTDDDNIAAPELRRGNQCADHHAGQAVEELPAGEFASIKWRDRKPRAIQERMILALQMLPRKGEASPGILNPIGDLGPKDQEKLTQRPSRSYAACGQAQRPHAGV